MFRPAEKVPQPYQQRALSNARKYGNEMKEGSAMAAMAAINAHNPKSGRDNCNGSRMATPSLGQGT
eukprot:4902698-Pyramimonas_sp.AAC.2